MDHFSKRVPVMDYLPAPKVVSKIQRQFILDVFYSVFLISKILRTLDTEEFDRFVQSNIAARQRKFIQKNNEIISILPQFATKIQNSNLISSIFVYLIKNSKKGKSPYDFKGFLKTSQNPCRT